MFKYLLGLIVSAIVGLFLLVDSSTIGLTVINTAIRATTNYHVDRNISFSDNQQLTLDVYRNALNSTDEAQDNYPVVIFFYGGAWSWGSKSLFHFAADAFMRKGYTVVVPDYTKYPEGKFPDFLYDGADAIVWTYNNISNYGGDKDNMFVVGHSAGAYIAALLGADSKYLTKAGGHTGMIKSIAGIAGPYNFTPQEQIYVDIFGQENFDVMRANAHITGSEPPMLLLHGKGDTTVGEFNYQTLFDKISQEQGVVELKIYEQNITHTNILLKLHPWFGRDINVVEDINCFFFTSRCERFI